MPTINITISNGPTTATANGPTTATANGVATDTATITATPPVLHTICDEACKNLD